MKDDLDDRVKAALERAALWNEVGDRLKNGQPVILNLQGVDRDLQRRLIDFSSGLTYALDGSMQRVADRSISRSPSFNFTIVLTPRR